MKKKIVILLAIPFLILSCKTKGIFREIDTEYSGNTYVVVIDSCEYLYIEMHNVRLFSHKGNCRFCKIRNN